MLAMASGGLGLSAVASHYTESRLWQFLDYQSSHVEWVGCAFWDLIQPSFMFMVGVALPYSFASRISKGESTWWRGWHTAYRSALLVALGVFLYSIGRSETNYTFVNVLAQIGLGYWFVYLLVGRSLSLQLGVALAILAAYWLAFVLYPAPGADFDWRAVGVPDDFPRLTGLFAHWNKNANAAAAFDVWFLNQFPRSEPFRYNGGGYQTLNFIPSMATMIFGLMAGEMLRSNRIHAQKLRWLIAAGLLCLGTGWLLGETVCPLVKRIWTPSWAIFSSGWTFLMLAAFFWVIDMRGYRRWAFALVIVGMNSIAIYLMAETLKPFIVSNLKTHFGQDLFSGVYGPIWQSAAVVLVLWLACLWMYRQRIFVRI